MHRIDKNTSGILVVAKNERSHARLAKQFFDHSIHRVYHALVWGNMEADEGTVVGNIGRSVRDRLKMAVFPDGDGGKHAVTHYRVLERLGYVNLIECRLETGARTRSGCTWNTSVIRCSTTNVTAAIGY